MNPQDPRSPSAAKEREVAAIRCRELLIPLAYGERLRRIDQLLARFEGLLPPGPEARFQIAEKIKAQVDALAGPVAADRLPDPALCECGHARRWHSHHGAGDCEYNGACQCQSFVAESFPVSAAVSPAEPPEESATVTPALVYCDHGYSEGEHCRTCEIMGCCKACIRRAEPSVSPADTIRADAGEAIRWYITELSQPNVDKEAHRLEALGCLDALLAVGERDKAEIERLTNELNEADNRTATQQGRAHSLATEVELLTSERERDGRQIAQFTEALEQIRANLTIDSREGVWAPLNTASVGGNWPVYDERGRRVMRRECRRRPSMPFRAPRCHEKPARRIGWNRYRCTVCAARIEPERLRHRLLLGRNPFRPDGTWRDLFYVTRWAHD